MRKITLFLGLFLCLSMTHAQTNIMADFNGDFENGLTSWRFFEVPNELGSTALTTTSAASGTKAAMVIFVGADETLADRGFDNWGANPPINGGRLYNFKAMLKSNMETGSMAKMTLGFFDASGTYIGENKAIISLSNIYKEYTLQTIAPANAASCFMAFRITDADGKAADGVLYIDNVQLYLDPAETINLFSGMNSDFEAGTFESWRFIEIGLPTQKSIQEISTDAHGGTYAGKIIWGQDPAIVEVVFDQLQFVTPGMVSTYKAWAKSLSGPFMQRIHCTFYDDALNIMGDVADESWILTDAYTEHSYVLPAVPEGATTVNIGFRAFNADGTRWPATTVTSLIDDVQLLQSLTSAIPKVNTVKSTISPNPASAFIKLTSDNAIKLASIYSIAGLKVKDVINDFTKIDVSDLTSGIYIVKTITEGGESTQKLAIK